MNLLEAKDEILCNIEAGNATELFSGSGQGKSSLAFQVYEEWAKQYEPGSTGFGVVFAATMSPIDDMGVPFKGTRKFTLWDGTEKDITVTDPTVPLWMLSIYPEVKPAPCYKHFFLFIDEKDKANPETSRGLSEIMLSGGNGYWRLPEGSPRLAASNRGARYGSQKRFDFEIARRTEVPIEGNVDITVEHWDKPYMWAGQKRQVLPVIKFWAKQNSSILFEPEPKEQGPWCHPRGVCAYDRYLQAKMARFGGKLPLHDKAQVARMTAMGAGTIGMGATASIISHLQFKLELPQYEDVIADPQNTPVPTKADMRLLMAYELAGQTKVDDLANVLPYVSRLGSEFPVTYVQALLRRDYKNIINSPAMSAWVTKNASLISIIEALAH